MIFLGIDCGLEGALAFIADNEAWVTPMPVVHATKGRDRYDLTAILSKITEYEEQRPFAMIEKLQPMPLKHGGAIANFSRGYAMAIVEMAMVATSTPYELVSPRTWQKVMHAGTSGEDLKQRSIMAASRLFPGVSLLRTERSKKPSDGIAEALLLAEYARRQHVGQKALAQ